MDAFAGIYAIGFFISWAVLYMRADFPPGGGWLEFWLPNFWWFVLMILKAWAWPVTLGHWYYNGCRPSQWKAVTRLDGREVRQIVRVGANG